MKDDNFNEECSLPRATVDRAIQDSFSNNDSAEKPLVEKKARSFLQEAASKFLMTVASKANEYAQEQSKKTLCHEHIFESLKIYGFSDFIPECKKSFDDYNEYSKLKPSKQNKFKESGLTMEELRKEQEKLFMEAKNDSNTNNTNKSINDIFSEDLVIKNVETVNNKDSIDGE